VLKIPISKPQAKVAVGLKLSMRCHKALLTLLKSAPQGVRGSQVRRSIASLPFSGNREARQKNSLTFQSANRETN
jgi:hypothetical protein